MKSILIYIARDVRVKSKDAKRAGIFGFWKHGGSVKYLLRSCEKEGILRFVSMT
jgi:hypothetical protein